MPFPDADRALVTEEKVRDYLLNPNHPVGGPKATWVRINRLSATFCLDYRSHLVQVYSPLLGQCVW